MSGPSLPPGAVLRLQGDSFQLSSPYSTVFLMPPGYRTYAASDPQERTYREYDLDTGRPIRTVLGPDLYHTDYRRSDGTRVALATADGGCRVVDLADGRV